MICRRATYLTDLEMIEYYQKMCDWNSLEKIKAKWKITPYKYAKK